MSWLHYLAEANLYLGAFYLCYCLFLNRETHYTLNRVFLLFSCVVSLVLPLIQLGFLKPAQVMVEGAAYIPVVNNDFTWQDGLLYSYLTGVFILTVQFGLKLYQLQKLIRLNAVVINDYKLIYLEETNTAFSFFNYLFVGTQTPQTELITRHELVHIRQKHSADIIFLELFKIVNWFNPLVYLLQNSLKSVHEFIADEQTALQEADALAYSTFLVNNAYGVTGSSITHSFFNYNLLKKRIIMLNQKRSGSLARLKYLLALPLCAGLLCESTLGFSKTYGFFDIAPKNENGTVLTTDTIRKNTKASTRVKVTNVRLTPPPPPEPPVPNKKTPAVTTVHIAPPPPPEPPVAKKRVKVTDVKLLPPPPPPVPPARKVKRAASELDGRRIDEPVQIRIDEPVTAKEAKPLQEIRIDEPVPAKKAATGKEIRISTEQ